MDRRWSTRKAIVVDVSIRRGDATARFGRCRNVGLEGMFVETDDQLFSRGMGLELEFELDDGSIVERHRLPVVAVRVSQHGVGAMFLAFHATLFRSLERLLYERPSIDVEFAPPANGAPLFVEGGQPIAAG